MKLSALYIKNFKGIIEEVKIVIDDIVVLVGPNNCCKSTVLDAYVAYCSLGKELSLDYFHNRDSSLPIVLTGVFTEVSHEDIELIGREWLLSDDPDFGRCAKFRIKWDAPNKNGVKFSFSNKTNEWKEGGAGGFDSLLKSRLPKPIRINPNDGTDDLEKVLKDLVAKGAKQKINSDKSQMTKILKQMNELAKEVESEVSSTISGINQKIEKEVNKLFSGISVGFETGVGQFKPEEIIRTGSRFILSSGASSASLEHQGSGVKRAFLWSAISALCSENLYKIEKTTLKNEDAKVLLVDEPEINLHPAAIRAARKAIYALASVEGWQVMCTTHSPIFIDLTNDHTTLIKVSNNPEGVYYFQTDKSVFSKDEKENLKTLNKCCPTVNEFFFYENSILVEGDTEYLVYQYLIEREKLEGSYCVVNCRGKANLPIFIKMFNQFRASAIAVHDLDTKTRSDGSVNSMWKMNAKIREAADSTSGRVKTVVHNPDFEGYYLNESPKKDKPYNIFLHLSSDAFEKETKYDKLRSSLRNIIDGLHDGLYTTATQIEQMA